MSKKKKIFKKKFKAEVIAQLKKTEEPKNIETSIPEQSSVRGEDEKPKIENVKPQAPSIPTHSPQIQPTPRSESPVEAKQTIADLKKTALIFGSLVILLLIIYYISLKTTLVAQFADLLAKWLHIQ